jgi:hypothetical protein
LQLFDEAEPVEMTLVVVADASLELGRREESLLRVVADRARWNAGALRQVVDAHLHDFAPGVYLTPGV